MSKIDYSQFYIKNYMPNKDTKLPKSLRKIKTKSSKGQTLIIIISVLIILALILVNLHIAGFSFDKIKKLFAKDSSTHNYYLLTKEFNERDRAYAQSLLVRQSGAGGYIYQHQEKYIVVYSVYLSKEDAEDVARKNPSTKVESINFVSNEFNNNINNAVKELIYASQQLEKGKIYESQLVEICSTIKGQLSEMKSQYLENDNAEKKVMLLNVFIGGLSSMEFPSPSRINLLGDLRYVICSVLLSLK